MNKYSDQTLIALEKILSQKKSKVTLDSLNLTLEEIISVARFQANTKLTDNKHILKQIKTCYEKMIEDIKNGVPIYGCNTGYGGRAGHVLNHGTTEERLNIGKKISEGIIHVDVTTGPEFTPDIVRAAMLIRINMLMKGVSAIKIQDLEIYKKILNKNITPIVNQYGGVGASGDLHHNGRVLSAARQILGTKVRDSKGNIREAKNALQEAGIEKLVLDPKAGLGFVNGDNFSSAVATLLTYDTLQCFILSIVCGAMIIEVLKGTDRSFHPLLSKLRAHPGQEEASSMFRYLLHGSHLAYQETNGHIERPNGIKVQDGYSLRCISQYYAPDIERIKQALDTISINVNSVSDNPLWVSPEHALPNETPWQWVSGGNFIAMHMVEVMDSLRKIMTHIVKINDRHMNRLINIHENNGLPPNLSDKSALTQCSFKGVQTHSGMLEVYSSLLSIPVSTFFGIHEESNQDITSHALTSGILGLENLRLARYSLAQNFTAIAQAVDLRGGEKLLSPQTQPVYKFIREKTNYVKEERPIYHDMEAMYQSIFDGSMMKIIREKVFDNKNEL